MILKRLCEFTERIPDLPPSMYSPLAFKWQIELDEDGNYRGITPLSDGARVNKGLTLLAPNVKRTSAVKPLLIADNAKYVLGIGTEKPGNSPHFAEYFDLVKQCAEETKEKTVWSIVKFLKSHQSDPVLFDQQLEPGDNITFRVGQVRPVDLQSVQKFWVTVNAPSEGDDMQCLVCGQIGPVDRVSPVAIKGIPGGQSSGMALVSANKNAFESYGAEQAFIAPTCRSCGEAYANAINYMLRSEHHHINIGPTSFLFWTADGSDFDVALFLGQPKPEHVRDLIKSYRTGRPVTNVDADAFYALSLSASASRVVVRDWLDTTVSAVQENLGRWFDLQHIVDPYGSEARPFGVYALAASLYLKPNDQMVAEIPRALVSCALSGGKLQDYVLAQAVARNQAEQCVTSNRAALIKAVLLSQMNDYREGYMEKLEEKCESPGYLCGRLLAEIEGAQAEAQRPRKLKTTVVDRFYGAASTAPMTVFPYLMRQLRIAWLHALKGRPVYTAIDKRVEEIVHELPIFPSTLTLKEQAMFALGYYHQKAMNRASAISYAEQNASTIEITEEQENETE